MSATFGIRKRRVQVRPVFQEIRSITEETSERISDGLFLAVVCLVSAAPYITKLGFYDDDWQFWSAYNACSHRSLVGLVSCSKDFGIADVRPVYRVYIALMYWLFRNDPKGCHVLMLAVAIAGIVILYLSLAAVGLPRRIAVTVPLVYASLPHYYAAEVWIACCEAELSMCLFFFASYFAIRAAHSGLKLRWLLITASVSSMLCSALSYEVAIPLLVLVPTLFWHQSRANHGSTTGLPHRRILIAITSCGVGAASLGKLFFQTRVEYHFLFLSRIWSVLVQGLGQLLTFNFGRYGLGMPRTVWEIIKHDSNGETLVITFALAVGIVLYLRMISDARGGLPSKSVCAVVAGSGLLIFCLGYSLVAVQPAVVLTATGGDNRVAIASALGTAMMEVAAVAWLSECFPNALRAGTTFSVLAAIISVSGFLATSTLASFWVSSFRTQEKILDDIKVQFPTLSEGTTVLLDGVCTTEGPGPVFGTDYDLAGALRIMYRDQTLKANVVTSGVTVEEQFLRVQNASGKAHYRYQPNVIVYDFRRSRTARLINAEEARRYFNDSSRRHTSYCVAEEHKPF